MAPNKVDFSKLNLEGVQVIDKDGQDNFMYQVKRIATPSKALIATLESESNSKIVSPLYELDETSSFKNIYVYVGMTADGKYEFVEALENKSGSIFIVDMDITDVEKSAMICTHGPADDLQTLTVRLRSGDWLP